MVRVRRPDDAIVVLVEEVAVLLEDLQRRSPQHSGVRLRPIVDATTVRVRAGETLVSDGPFAETKDFVGGVVIIDCADLDDAIAIASGHPYARWGGVEIRPIWE